MKGFTTLLMAKIRVKPPNMPNVRTISHWIVIQSDLNVVANQQ